MSNKVSEPKYNHVARAWVVEETDTGTEHRFDTHVEAQEFYDTWR